MKYLLAFVICVIAGASAAPEGRLTGGAPAARNQFPYQVSVQWGIIGIWQHVCGGSILTFNRVLTAGHCVTERPPIGGSRIRAGILHLDDEIVGVQQIAISSSLVHPAYEGGMGPNDLAILRLSVSLTITPSVATIPLPTVVGAIPAGNAILTGWGSISTTVAPTMPNTLHFATVPIILNAACITALGPFGPLLTATNVCTGPGTGAIPLSACMGDAGSPLVLNNVLVGVVSWSLTCVAPVQPTVYVQTSSFITWITTNLV